MAHITVKSRKYKHNLAPYMPSCELFPAKYYSADLQSFVMADTSTGFSVICEPVVVRDGSNYANKALGISHCIDRLEGCADQYRQQAENEV